MDKIILRYKGGLGNQMFIYAMQLALEKHYPGREILADTTRYLLHNEHNGYELPSVWGIDPAKADKETIKRASPYLVPAEWMLRSPRPVKNYICSNWQYKYYESRRWKKKIAEHYYRQEDHYTYDPTVWNLGRDSHDYPEHADFGRGNEKNDAAVIYLDGLWQNMEYFAGIEDEIHRAFCLDINGHSRFEDRYTDYDKEILGRITEAGYRSVSIHVRRGDFTGSKFDICGPKYYETALKRLESEVSSGEAISGGILSDSRESNLQYFIFTDDTDYASAQFKDLQGAVFVNHDAAHSFMDMDLMSRCRHHIVSNSTFAWWGAYLSGAKADGTGSDGTGAGGAKAGGAKAGECGVTIAPMYSLCRKGDYTPLSTPEGWIRLEV